MPAKVDTMPSDGIEEEHLHEVDEVQSRSGAVSGNCFCYLLAGTLVFVLGRVECQLAHIFHVDLLALLRAIDTTRDVA